MPEVTMTSGDGWRIDLDEHDDIVLAAHDCDSRKGCTPREGMNTERVAWGVGVRFGDGWQLVATERLVDELEQRWRHPTTDGHVEAIVRHVFGESPLWNLRVQLVNRGPSPATVPGCHLALETTWPARRWLAGAEGQVSLDPAQPGVGLATLTQLRGRCRLSDDLLHLTDLPVRLAPTGEPGSQYQVAWRLDVLPTERTQAAALPTWWPAATALHTGDIVRLDLPDAAIEGAGLQVLTDDDGTTLSGQCGTHLAQVHAGRGTTDVELHFADPLPGVLARHADQLVDERDPRAASPAEACLVARAATSHADAEAWLAAALDELLHRPGPLEPLALLASAERALADPSGAEQVAQALERTATRPGIGLARVRALMALQLAGLPPRLPATGPQSLSPVERSLIEFEHRLITGGIVTADDLRPCDWRLLGMLGAGLPGHTGEAVRRAQLVAITSLVGEGIDLSRRWPVPLELAREHATRRLVAERHGPEVLAWLSL